MPDVPFPPEKPEPKSAEVARDVERGLRAAFTGDGRGRLRRPILYGIVAIGIAIPIPPVAFFALILLALTDAVVEL